MGISSSLGRSLNGYYLHTGSRGLGGRIQDNSFHKPGAFLTCRWCSWPQSGRRSRCSIATSGGDMSHSFFWHSLLECHFRFRLCFIWCPVLVIFLVALLFRIYLPIFTCMFDIAPSQPPALVLCYFIVYNTSIQLSSCAHSLLLCTAADSSESCARGELMRSLEFVNAFINLPDKFIFDMGPVTNHTPHSIVMYPVSPWSRFERVLGCHQLLL